MYCRHVDRKIHQSLKKASTPRRSLIRFRVSKPRMLRNLVCGRSLSPVFAQESLQEVLAFGAGLDAGLFLGDAQDRVLRARKRILAVKYLRARVYEY